MLIDRYQKWYALWSQWSGFEQYGDVTPQIKPVSHWLKSTSRHGEYEAPISAAILIARTIEENAPMHPLKKEEYMLTMLKPLFKDALHLSHIKWSPFLKVLWVESHPILIALGLNTYAAKTSERSLSAFADQLTAVVKKQPLSYVLKRLEARAWSFKDPKYALTTLESLPEKAHTLLTAKLLSDLYIDQILYPHLHRSNPENTDSESTDSESTNPDNTNPEKTNPENNNPEQNEEQNEEQMTLKAKEHTKMALKRWSDSPRLLLNLTLLQALDHDSRDPYAIKQTLSSLNKNSLKSSRDHHRLGQIFIELKKSKSAKRVFKRADTLSPLHSSEIIERAHFYLEMKLYKQAIQSLRRLQTSELKTPSITHYLLGLSYLKSGQSKKAKRNFKAYLKEEPEGEHSENARRWITKKK